jgi:hypothetical protein
MSLKKGLKDSSAPGPGWFASRSIQVLGRGYTGRDRSRAEAFFNNIVGDLGDMVKYSSPSVDRVISQCSQAFSAETNFRHKRSDTIHSAGRVMRQPPAAQLTLPVLMPMRSGWRSG